MQLDLFPNATPAAAALPALANYLKPVWIGERLTCDAQTPEMALAYWFEHVTKHPWFDPDKEHLAVLLLNTKLRAFGWNLISIGSLNEAMAHPREIFRPAIAAAAYGILLMHNHPSGDSTPSDADRRFNARLKEAATLLNISLADHVIAGRTGSDPLYSFRAAGVL